MCAGFDRRASKDRATRHTGGGDASSDAEVLHLGKYRDGFGIAFFINPSPTCLARGIPKPGKELPDNVLQGRFDTSREQSGVARRRLYHRALHLGDHARRRHSSYLILIPLIKYFGEALTTRSPLRRQEYRRYVAGQYPQRISYT